MAELISRRPLRFKRLAAILHEALLRPGDVPGESAIIALPVPDEIAKQFPARAEDPSPPHITLLYVKSVPPERLEELERVVAGVVSSSEPVTINFRPGVEYFKSPKGQDIAHKGIDADGLIELQTALDQAVSAAGFNVSRYTTGFIPHATVAYGRHEGPAPEGSWTAYHVEIWGISEDTPEIEFGADAGSVKMAAIQHPPRNLKIYLKDILPKYVDTYLQAEQAARDSIAALDNEDRLLWDAGLSDFSRLYPGGLNKDLIRVKETAASVLRYDLSFLQYVISNLEYAEKDVLRLQQDFAEIDWERITRDVADHNEYAQRYGNQMVPPGTLTKLRAWFDATNAIARFIPDARAKLSERLSARHDERRPAHEAVEVMYHASVNARQLAQTGFSREVPETKGIGGSNSTKGYTPGTSFTSDLHVAKEIARCLKEVIAIANGEIKWRTVLRWAAEAGMDTAELERNARNTFLAGRPIPNEYRRKEKFWSDTAEPHKDTPKSVFGLYRTYLAHHPRRYDPLFFNVGIDVFKGLDPADVGIVKVKINTKHEKVEYMAAMHEWRVPPEAILSVDGFIGERPGRAASVTGGSVKMTALNKEAVGQLTVYHGTVSGFLPSIAETGLDPASSRGGRRDVYLTADFGTAQWYALHMTPNQGNGTPIVLEVSINRPRDVNQLTQDDADDNDATKESENVLHDITALENAYRSLGVEPLDGINAMQAGELEVDFAKDALLALREANPQKDVQTLKRMVQRAIATLTTTLRTFEVTQDGKIKRKREWFGEKLQLKTPIAVAPQQIRAVWVRDDDVYLKDYSVVLEKRKATTTDLPVQEDSVNSNMLAFAEEVGGHVRRKDQDVHWLIDRLESSANAYETRYPQAYKNLVTMIEHLTTFMNADLEDAEYNDFPEDLQREFIQWVDSIEHTMYTAEDAPAEWLKLRVNDALAALTRTQFRRSVKMTAKRSVKVTAASRKLPPGYRTRVYIDSEQHDPYAYLAEQPESWMPDEDFDPNNPESWPTTQTTVQFELLNPKGDLAARVLLDCLSGDDGRRIGKTRDSMAYEPGMGRALYSVVMDWAGERGVWVRSHDAGITEPAAKAWRSLYHDPSVSRQRVERPNRLRSDPSEETPDWDHTNAPHLFYEYRRGKLTAK